MIYRDSSRVYAWYVLEAWDRKLKAYNLNEFWPGKDFMQDYILNSEYVS